MSTIQEELKDNKSAERLVSQLGLKKEIEDKLKYYKAHLQVTANAITAIDQIVSGYGTDYSGLNPKVVLEICEYSMRKLELEIKMETQKNFIEMWLQRSMEYDSKMGKITEECNQHFEETVKKAREVAKTNLRLQAAMNNYDKSNNEDQLVKNEYWLYITKEIQNREEYLKSQAAESGANVKPLHKA